MKFLAGFVIGATLVALYHWANPVQSPQTATAGVVCPGATHVRWVRPGAVYACAQPLGMR